MAALIQAEITEKVKRITRALQLKPAMGLGTGISTASITNGLSCEIKEADWEFKADMPEAVGGTGTAPTPGVLGRAALGSCLAIGYMIWASKMGVPIEKLEVEVQALTKSEETLTEELETARKAVIAAMLQAEEDHVEKVHLQKKVQDLEVWV